VLSYTLIQLFIFDENIIQCGVGDRVIRVGNDGRNRTIKLKYFKKR